MDMDFVTTILISFQFIIPIAIIFAIFKFIKVQIDLKANIQSINDKLDKLIKK